MKIAYDEFQKLDIRFGTIISARYFDKANKPSYQLVINFGLLGIRKSSAQITNHYTPTSLIGKQVVAVINLPKKQIANFFSECLILGVIGPKKDVTLIGSTELLNNGTIIR